MKWWFVVFLVGLGSCTTPYQPMGASGGYADEPMGHGRYFVRVKVNTFTSAGEANLYLHRRANELCHAAGYASFTLNDALANEQGGVIVTKNAAIAVENKDVSAMVICEQGQEQRASWHCTEPNTPAQTSACFRTRRACLDYRAAQVASNAQVPCWPQQAATCAYVDNGRQVQELCAVTSEACAVIETWARGAGRTIIAPCAIRYPTDPTRPRL